MAFLGIDTGTSGTKVLLLSTDGKVLATAEFPHTMFTPKPGWTEQNPEEWWEAACKATRAVLKKAKVKEVHAIGLSGQMHGSVFLDGAGKVLRPALEKENIFIRDYVELTPDQKAKARKALIGSGRDH